MGTSIGMGGPEPGPAAPLRSYLKESTESLPVHPEMEDLAFLLGIWRGEGTGEYPTIKPFAYREEMVLTHYGKPYLVYSQRTWNLEDGSPLHSEIGFLRLCGPSPRRLEAVVAHSTGIVEICEGVLQRSETVLTTGKIELISTSIACTSTAKQVTAVGRSIQVEADVLRYRLRMAAGGLPAHHHLSAELVKVAS
jgi:hypothetical protein